MITERTTKVEINPNLRLPDGYTVVDLDEDIDGSVVENEQVEVFERTSGMVGHGWVVEIDEIERTATILVQWASLRIPVTEARVFLSYNFREEEVWARAV
jgi:hypothetical protein